ncbi:LysE family translocator [Cognatishimia maritima]|uniref:Threonine/homoserine/homoserine lactone efflux protein n=1 Tax=Cognatishimia maritima TaxID=870908 RepID=A0A1M5RPZ9_9RHOB|nr:LysE family translocator [Cognatishimia maritima]SHH28344.1 Threonine/homoserine/homoserine lactone efflux protein [Cognatishimia maritima]
MDFYLFLAFIPAALALNLTPGADMMFCLGQGLRSGTRAAVAASAGISMGSMVHVTLAGLGLGALVATLPWVFDLIRWVGVAYLLWLAVGALRGGAADQSKVKPLSAGKAFRQGFFVNLSNPKVILFVLAFVPQFVDPTQGHVLLQFISLGAIIAFGGFIVNALVGAFSGGMGRVLTGSPKFQRGIGYVTAAIFAGLAARLAIMEKA